MYGHLVQSLYYTVFLHNKKIIGTIHRTLRRNQKWLKLKEDREDRPAQKTKTQREKLSLKPKQRHRKFRPEKMLTNE